MWWVGKSVVWVCREIIKKCDDIMCGGVWIVKSDNLVSYLFSFVMLNEYF